MVRHTRNNARQTYAHLIVMIGRTWTLLLLCDRTCSPTTRPLESNNNVHRSPFTVKTVGTFVGCSLLYFAFPWFVAILAAAFCTLFAFLVFMLHFYCSFTLNTLCLSLQSMLFSELIAKCLKL